MDLNEQAEQALGELLVTRGLGLDRDAETIARMMWLDGFRAGMAVTKAHADEAFANLERAL